MYDVGKVEIKIGLLAMTDGFGNRLCKGVKKISPAGSGRNFTGSNFNCKFQLLGLLYQPGLLLRRKNFTLSLKLVRRFLGHKITSTNAGVHCRCFDEVVFSPAHRGVVRARLDFVRVACANGT
jgi:hypothetical protein